jgi:hypothetical protein
MRTAQQACLLPDLTAWGSAAVPVPFMVLLLPWGVATAPGGAACIRCCLCSCTVGATALCSRNTCTARVPQDARQRWLSRVPLSMIAAQ